MEFNRHWPQLLNWCCAAAAHLNPEGSEDVSPTIDIPVLEQSPVGARWAEAVGRLCDYIHMANFRQRRLLKLKDDKDWVMYDDFFQIRHIPLAARLASNHPILDRRPFDIEEFSDPTFLALVCTHGTLNTGTGTGKVGSKSPQCGTGQKPCSQGALARCWGSTQEWQQNGASPPVVLCMVWLCSRFVLMQRLVLLVATHSSEGSQPKGGDFLV